MHTLFPFTYTRYLFQMSFHYSNYMLLPVTFNMGYGLQF